MSDQVRGTAGSMARHMDPEHTTDYVNKMCQRDRYPARKLIVEAMIKGRALDGLEGQEAPHDLAEVKALVAQLAGILAIYTRGWGDPKALRAMALGSIGAAAPEVDDVPDLLTIFDGALASALLDQRGKNRQGAPALVEVDASALTVVQRHAQLRRTEKAEQRKAVRVAARAAEREAARAAGALKRPGRPSYPAALRERLDSIKARYRSAFEEGRRAHAEETEQAVKGIFEAAAADMAEMDRAIEAIRNDKETISGNAKRAADSLKAARARAWIERKTALERGLRDSLTRARSGGPNPADDPEFARALDPACDTEAEAATLGEVGGGSNDAYLSRLTGESYTAGAGTEPSQEDGDAAEASGDAANALAGVLEDGRKLGAGAVFTKGWMGRRCRACRIWVWGGPTICPACLLAERANTGGAERGDRAGGSDHPEARPAANLPRPLEFEGAEGARHFIPSGFTSES